MKRSSTMLLSLLMGTMYGQPETFQHRDVQFSSLLSCNAGLAYMQCTHTHTLCQYLVTISCMKLQHSYLNAFFEAIIQWTQKSKPNRDPTPAQTRERPQISSYGAIRRHWVATGVWVGCFVTVRLFKHFNEEELGDSWDYILYVHLMFI